MEQIKIKNVYHVCGRLSRKGISKKDSFDLGFTEELPLPRGVRDELILKRFPIIMVTLIHNVVFSRKFSFPRRCLNYIQKYRTIFASRQFSLFNHGTNGRINNWSKPIFVDLHSDSMSDFLFVIFSRRILKSIADFYCEAFLFYHRIYLNGPIYTSKSARELEASRDVKNIL